MEGWRNWKKDDFVQFRNGMDLEDLRKGKVPLLLMDHVRQMDVIISKGLSYERTIYTFLAQMELGENTMAMKKTPFYVVLLNEEGALIRDKGKTTLIFTPSAVEQSTVALDAELYPIYEALLQKLEAGDACAIDLTDIPMRRVFSNKSILNLLDEYCTQYTGGYLAVAQDIVINGPDKLYHNVPVCHYGGLSSVDIEEMEGYHAINSLLADYVKQVELADGHPVKPLSLAVFGAPGSGKSFGIKQIAKSSNAFKIVTLNLSQFKDYEEMAKALQEALKSEEKTPLIFFDEFDSEYAGIARGWLKYLLVPMQDGEFNCGGKTVEIEKAVFVFAGGTASSFESFAPTDEEGLEEFKAVKGPDFVSRLKGILNIKGPNPTNVTDKSYIIRRVLLLRDMLSRKSPTLLDEKTGEANISRGLLTALLRASTYRHGTRSLEFILDMSRLTGVSKFTPSCLPLENQMNIHIDVVDFYKKMVFLRLSEETFEEFCRNVHETRVRQTVQKFRKENKGKNIAMLLKKDPSLKPWEQLTEEMKDDYRLRMRDMAEEMSSPAFPIGFRPKTKGMKDVIRDLQGEELELLSRLDHETWLNEMRRNGWTYGEKHDADILLSPQIVEYDELDDEQKDAVRARIKLLPVFMKAVDMEMYRKPYTV